MASIRAWSCSSSPAAVAAAAAAAASMAQLCFLEDGLEQKEETGKGVKQAESLARRPCKYRTGCGPWAFFSCRRALGPARSGKGLGSKFLACSIQRSSLLAGLQPCRRQHLHSTENSGEVPELRLHFSFLGAARDTEG
jgi:hypothetical protein